MNKQKIFLISDADSATDMFSSLIENESDLEICGKAVNLPEFLAASRNTSPDVILLELPAGEETQNLQLMRSIKTFAPDLPILVLSDQDENIYAETALHEGARGYVMKQESPEIILAAIRRVLSDDIYLSQKLASKMLQEFVKTKRVERESFGVESLSDRELEIFELIGRGLSTRKTANRLKLSIKTIETHRSHIKQKLKLDDSAELAYHAFHWVNSTSAG